MQPSTKPSTAINSPPHKSHGAPLRPHPHLCCGQRLAHAPHVAGLQRTHGNARPQGQARTRSTRTHARVHTHTHIHICVHRLTQGSAQTKGALQPAGLQGGCALAVQCVEGARSKDTLRHTISCCKRDANELAGSVSKLAWGLAWSLSSSLKEQSLVACLIQTSAHICMGDHAPAPPWG